MINKLFLLVVSGFIVLAPLTAYSADKAASQKGKPTSVQTMVMDPVCLMDVDPAKTNNVYEYKGKKYFFCSKGDLEKFKKDPKKYIKK